VIECQGGQTQEISTACGVAWITEKNGVQGQVLESALSPDLLHLGQTLNSL